MRRVKTQAVVNVAASSAGSAGSKLANEERAAYRDEIRRLREEIALYDVIAGRTRAHHESKEGSTQPENLRRQQVIAFLANGELVPPVQSLGQVQRLLHTFRSVYLEQSSLTEPVSNQARKSGSKMVTQIRSLRDHTPPDLSPSSVPVSSSSNNNSTADTSASKLPPLFRDNQRDQQEPQQRVAPVSLPVLRPRENDKDLFERFKSVGGANPGAEALRDLEQAKLNLREAKAQCAALVLAVNSVKLEIDTHTLQLQELREHGMPDQLKEGHEIERQSVPLLQLQDAKKRYRAAFEQLQEKKAEVGYLSKIKAQMLQQVALQFQAWKDRQEEGPEAVAGEWPG